MNKVAIMDTSIMSFNLGDQIIMESVRYWMNTILQDAYVVNMPVHSPLFHKYEFSIRNDDWFKKSLDSLQFKFICGTNLIEKNMHKRKNSWNIHLSDLKYIGDFILVGVGTDGIERDANRYTKKFYKKALSAEYIHSVRDERTRVFLEKMGIQALNTGCPTMWSFTQEHCKKIKKEKSDKVIFTLTDYAKDRKKDLQLVECLKKNYDELFFWPQGIMDYQYYEEIVSKEIREKVQIISPSLSAYNSFLEKNDCDYVGTRLHAGMKAMQKYRRSIIIGVDNRTADIKHDYNIVSIDRDNQDEIEELIMSEFSTEISIHNREISAFLAQFKK